MFEIHGMLRSTHQQVEHVRAHGKAARGGGCGHLQQFPVCSRRPWCPSVKSLLSTLRLCREVKDVKMLHVLGIEKSMFLNFGLFATLVQHGIQKYTSRKWVGRFHPIHFLFYIFCIFGPLLGSVCVMQCIVWCLVPSAGYIVNCNQYVQAPNIAAVFVYSVSSNIL